MTTAQDQQSRAELLQQASDWICENVPTGTPGATTWAKRLQEAARALPAPENVREGEPYDNPAFEDLARTMGVWGTAQAALCAQFFLAGRGAVPAGVEPVGYVGCDDHGADVKESTFAHLYQPLPSGTDLFTAAEVLAMGRVPPALTDPEILGAYKRIASDHADGRGFDAAIIAFGRAMLGAAAPRPPAAPKVPTEDTASYLEQMFGPGPRPPAAQEGKPLTDEQLSDMRGADLGALNFVTLRQFRGIARAVESAHGIKDPAHGQ